MILSISHVQAAVDAQAFGKVIDPIISVIINPILMLLFGVATVVFVYGALQIVMNGGADAESRTKWKDSVLWGLVGMFIMVSAWGIIKVISNTVLSL